ncbi:hypothetical protein GS891_09310 [Rhodococcus hoagii]|nr:hypothetical protein [Prescottella equi]
MTGRVAQLEVGFWSVDDLKQIANRGFAALNVMVSDALVTRMVGEAFQSPHLMQEFCRQLCADNDISETVSIPAGIGEPDWKAFFSRLAPGASKAAFDLLARGPRQRSDRKVRHLRDGGETDIYGAVLRAIAFTGPLTEITYEQLRAALRSILASSDEPPQKHEVTRVLDEMTRIAREQIDGEPWLTTTENLPLFTSPTRISPTGCVGALTLRQVVNPESTPNSELRAGVFRVPDAATPFWSRRAADCGRDVANRGAAEVGAGAFVSDLEACSPSPRTRKPPIRPGTGRGFRACG